jgi:exosortase A
VAGANKIGVVAAQGDAVWGIPLAALGVTLVAVIAAYFGTAAGIVEIWWRSGTFTHGFLVVPIVAYLIWRDRARVAGIDPAPQPLALALLGLIALAWLAARLLEINAAQQFAVVALIPAAVWALLGTRVARALAFPLAYLFFVVPFGEFLVPALQDITAAFTVWALNVTRIPVLWEGRFFYIPSGSFEVATACSGVRYLIASIALGTLYAYLSYRALWRRVAFIAVAAVVPVVANGIRAYMIVMLAHFSDYQLAVGVDHFIYGWVFFGAVMFLLFWVGHFFRDPAPDMAASAGARSATAAGVRWPLWTAAAVAVVASAPLANTFAFSAKGADLAVTLPEGRDAWRGPFDAVEGWTPRFLGASAQQRADYQRDGHTVQVYAAYYARQSAQAELISSENTLYDSRRDRRIEDGPIEIVLQDGRRWPAHETRIQTPAGMRLLWHWYVVDGREVANPVMAKLLEARARLRRNPIGSSVVVLAAEYDVEPDRARERLRVFLAALAQPLRESVGVGP